MKLYCPKCKQEYDVLDSESVGKKFECGVCGKKFYFWGKKVLLKRKKCKTIKEELLKLKEDFKLVSKYASAFSKINQLGVADYLINDDDLMENADAAICELSENYEEAIDELQCEISSRKEEIFDQWNDECSVWVTQQFFKKPTLEQFWKLTDYLDINYSPDWSRCDNDFEILHKEVKNLFPELIK